jgi:hypothetical protein
MRVSFLFHTRIPSPEWKSISEYKPPLFGQCVSKLESTFTTPAELLVQLDQGQDQHNHAVDHNQWNGAPRFDVLGTEQSQSQLQKQICVTSYNSTGFGLAAQDYIEELLLFSNILCLQEHFLLDSKDKKYSNTNRLRRKLKKLDMFIVPAHKENNQVSKERGKGGLATIWDKNITKYVSKIKCENYRLQATKFEFPSGSFLVINTYFPCDPRTINFDDTDTADRYSNYDT